MPPAPLTSDIKISPHTTSCDSPSLASSSKLGGSTPVNFNYHYAIIKVLASGLNLFEEVDEVFAS